MVNFSIKSLTIIDYGSKRANKFNFGEHTNLIVSKSNTTGKSSLIKSIYYALGTDLKSLPTGWNIDGYIFQIVIIVDETEYIIERQNKIISVNENKTTRIFKDFREYSDWLQKILKMNLTLVGVKNDIISQAYASAIFAPIYIDQDSSWDGTLFKNTFNGLGQYKSPNFQKDIIDYYLGLGDSELKNYKQEQVEIKKKIDGKALSINEIDNVYNSYKKQHNVSEVDTIDIQELENQVNEFLDKTNELSGKISNIMKKISDNQVLMDINRQDSLELEKISKNIEKRLDTIDYECSYCHSILTREQSLTRLELNDDLSQIYAKKREIDFQIVKLQDVGTKNKVQLKQLKNEFAEYKERISEINDLISIKKYVNQNVLNELGKLRRKENNDKEALKSTYDDLAKEIRKIQTEIRKKKSDINQEFEILKNNIETSIGTLGISNRKYGEFSKVGGSGTEKNKQLLSLYLIYINLLSAHSNYRFPISIDSFTKNELDKASEKNMYQSVNDYFLTLPNQTIFAIIKDNLQYIEKKDVQIIEVSKPLLLESMYDELFNKLLSKQEN
ncbi:endonuclease [Streptococcus hillyeri]|uniref:Endonuclease n=1 Tax=Streptococcus hillyeri TaxID=2282420 RepID=A0A3L9DRR2_9STRE|nr:endonuclease [Streptococcus hillyeri]RLY03234.1 endonuclease [Streptococcus hillyeri]